MVHCVYGTTLVYRLGRRTSSQSALAGTLFQFKCKTTLGIPGYSNVLGNYTYLFCPWRLMNFNGNAS